MVGADASSLSFQIATSGNLWLNIHLAKGQVGKSNKSCEKKQELAKIVSDASYVSYNCAVWQHMLQSATFIKQNTKHKRHGACVQMFKIWPGRSLLFQPKALQIKMEMTAS